MAPKIKVSSSSSVSVSDSDSDSSSAPSDSGSDSTSNRISTSKFDHHASSDSDPTASSDSGSDSDSNSSTFSDSVHSPTSDDPYSLLTFSKPVKHRIRRLSSAPVLSDQYHRLRPLIERLQLRRKPKNIRSTYKTVTALLIQWEDDDLGVEPEVKRLGRVLGGAHFNFSVKRWKIPSANSRESLIHRVLKLQRGKTSNDLLIIYYGGHAAQDDSKCVWAAKRTGGPTLSWNPIFGLLLDTEVDSLTILDCCYASTSAHGFGLVEGSNWVLAASGKESEAGGVTPNSFTRCLIRQLTRLSYRYWSDDQKCTIRDIHSNLHKLERDLETTPNLVAMVERECWPIDITPLLSDKRRLRESRSATPLTKPFRR